MFEQDIEQYLSCFRGINELRNLQYLPRASEARETLVEDRTRSHADHVGQGFDRMTTAAVGLLKAVHCDEKLVNNCVVFMIDEGEHWAYSFLANMAQRP